LNRYLKVILAHSLSPLSLSHTHTLTHNIKEGEGGDHETMPSSENLIICQDLSLLKETKVFNGFSEGQRTLGKISGQRYDF